MPILKKGMCPLLTADVVKKCKENGIKTVYELISNDPEKLACQCNISYKDIISIINVLQAQFSAPILCAYDLYNEQLSTLAIFSIGCPRLDDLLDGGIYTGEIIEFVGPPAAGKTQLCHSLVTTVGLETQCSMLYIDTSGGFCCQRIHEMMRIRNVPETNVIEVLHRIHCIEIHDLFTLMQTLEEIKSHLISQKHSIYSSLKLVILDSITAIVSPHLGVQLNETQGLMVHLAHLLKSICCDHALAIVICNNTVHGEGSVSKPALGQYWQYVPSVVLRIEKDNSDRKLCSPSRCATVTKSCRECTPVSTLLKLTAYGIEGQPTVTDKARKSLIKI